MKVADGIHRIGSDPTVNAYLVEEAGEVTIIDAAMPGFYGDKVVSPYGDGATIDVPGSPKVTLVPGHTPGSAVLSVPARDALFVGDAFATYAVTDGGRGPRIAPFTADRGQALESLQRIVDSPAGVVLPGHGQPWTLGMAEAVRLVKASEPVGARSTGLERPTTDTAAK
jgi:glyoxylase-like metal-dependent hydrolase (beta-lactamase superfamily II)